MPAQQRGWFPLAQIAPAIVFAGLWGWDRRRRYYEKHPDILLRRKARRALRRQWRSARRAAQAKDAPGFAAAAVSAMQVACAPHYPAEPRALVGSDVLALLSQGLLHSLNYFDTVDQVLAHRSAIGTSRR